MGQLFNRITRVVRAELNSNKSDYSENYLNEGTALVAGGAVVGASIGKVGILAGGTGYSLGAIPLAAAGALTGAALYEALRSLIEDDASSANAVVMGAATGAAVSATIGGVGVSVGGSAVGVGMASMAAGGTIVGLGLVGLNRLLQQGIDPEKLLDTAIDQMEADLQNARQAIVNVMASQKRFQQQYEQTQAEVKKWERRAQLALEKGDEYLAREALSRKKMHSGILSSLKAQIDREPAAVKNLKQNLTLLAAKISEAKIMRTSLKAQIAAARANGQMQSTASSLGINSAMAAFERMEQKVLQKEASLQASELARDVDDELAVLKAQMLASYPQSQSHSSGSKLSNSASSGTAVDAELEELRRQIDGL